MLETLKFGKGNWANKTDSTLAYSDQYGNFQAIPFDFTRATTATRVNKQGLIESVNDGIARIDYSDSTQGALLLEPERTNLITYSNDYANTYWQKSKTGSAIAPIVTSNYAISPDGTQNADRIQFDATTSGSNSDTSRFRTTITLVDGLDYTISFYAKSKGVTDQKIGIIFDNSQRSVFTITNEWQRFTKTSTQTGTNSICGLDLRGAVDSTSDILVYGIQVEQGSYATSYIPTNGVIATRNQEICKNATPEINSEEGVLYAEISALDNPTSQEIALSVSEGQLGANRLLIRMKTNGAIGIVLRVANTTQATIDSGVLNQLANHKVAVKWKVNDIALWIDGVEVGTDNLANVFPVNTLDEFSFNQGNNSNQFYGNTKDVRVYNTALTDAQLQTLTTI